MRGEFNGWADPAAPETQFYQVTPGAYEAEFELAAGTYGFKIANAGWTSEYTNGGTPQITVPSINDLGNSGGNSSLVIPADGCYNFAIIGLGAGTPPPQVELTVTQQ